MKKRLLPRFLFLLSLAAFLVRGPFSVFQHLDERGDFANPFVGAKAWAQGKNPYDSSTFWEVWRQAGGRPLPETDSLDSRPPFPLSAFVVLAPLTPLSWPAARVVAMVVTIGLVALAVVTLAQGLREAHSRLLFAGLALAMAPLHTGIRTSTVSVAAIAFLMLSVSTGTCPPWRECCAKGDRSLYQALVAGVCIAFASLKPQLALPFIVYHVVRRSYRVAALALVAWASLMAVGAARLAAGGVPWMPGYISSMRLVLDDPKNIFTADNALRFQLINLQPFVYSIVANASLTNLVSVTAAALLFIAWWVRVRRAKARSELLEAGGLSVICLLPVYHRFYDAWLLALPLCWALETPQTRDRRIALALMAPFVVPIVGLVEWLMAAGLLSPDLVNRWWWNAGVMSLQIWSLLVLATVLVSAVGRVGQVGQVSEVGSASRTR